jgi:hypothetical protein
LSNSEFALELAWLILNAAWFVMSVPTGHAEENLSGCIEGK